MIQPQTPRPANGISGGDFLPNLCSSQAVFLLVLLAQLLALLITVADSGLRVFSWEQLALVSFMVQWIVLLSAMLLCRLRLPLRRWPPRTAGALSFLLVMAITLVVSLASQWLQYSLWGRQQRIDRWQLGEQLLVAAILVGIGLRYLYVQQQLRNQQAAELQARVQALQARIRPHFLFNSMNSIASLIGSDPDTAERVVEDLADLFRASLAEPARVPIHQELELARRYLAIENLRLGRRLRVDWQVDDLPEEQSIPSLLLQPLLENAVFHGIEPLPGGGCVQVRVQVQAEQMVIEIQNPVPDVVSGERPAQRHNRMALDNIRHRLAAHYGDAASLSVEAAQGCSVEAAQGCYSVRISYPRE